MTNTTSGELLSLRPGRGPASTSASSTSAALVRTEQCPVVLDSRWPSAHTRRLGRRSARLAERDRGRCPNG